MGAWFVEQISRYSSYHRDGRNKAIHFIGVPAIAVSLLLPPALVKFGTTGWYDISLATAFAAAVWVYWIALDRPFGIVTSLAFLPALPFADWLAAQGEAAVGIVFAILFVGGWAVQLAGHAFEGRKPALVDNFIQVFITPMFLIAEVAFALGLRKPLAAEVEARWRDYLPESAKSDTAQAL
ncbi:MAG: DUF962 domain-containing protein [Rhodospirillaceae bacterium]|nr:DUF962 domain-containing protein [Rhodospirillaceae bacterium]MDE0617916.1 DUF962 domain-containing protein [Rhodospirillaceae bacterium]